MKLKNVSQTPCTSYDTHYSTEEKLKIFDDRRKLGLPLTKEDLCVKLEANWDVEFVYNNINCEIVHDGNNILLFQTSKGKETKQTFKSKDALLNKAIIDNKPFLEVWQNSKYT